jgi:gamma-glutamylcyclotransferase (GGCT)/AIG2-like uncharacterized protein YtfP
MKLFVYGSLKPGQLGHDFFRRNQISVSAHGRALLRDFQLADFDGVPVAVAAKDNQIYGQLLEIEGENIASARTALELYEGFSSATDPPIWARPIRWESGTVELDSETTINSVEFFALHQSALNDDDRERLSVVESDEWNMSKDQVFLRVLPTVWRELEQIAQLGELPSKDAEPSYDSDMRYVHLLGCYMVLYTCLERFVRHRFGPTRFIEPPRGQQRPSSVAVLLGQEYFSRSRQAESRSNWFDVAIEGVEVFEMASRASNVSLSQKPARFWHIVRNNLSHQSKVPTYVNYRLVLAAAVTLGDFLPQCLLNSPNEVGQQFSQSWRKISESLPNGVTQFPPPEQHLQKIYLSKMTR